MHNVNIFKQVIFYAILISGADHNKILFLLREEHPVATMQCKLAHIFKRKLRGHHSTTYHTMEIGWPKGRADSGNETHQSFFAALSALFLHCNVLPIT